MSTRPRSDLNLGEVSGYSFIPFSIYEIWAQQVLMPMPGVQLSAELEQLAESIAHNVHEVWAKRRIDDGWTYGPRRDEGCKIHSSLVSYEDLCDGESEYDRAISRETIKLILKFGFRILPPDNQNV